MPHQTRGAPAPLFRVGFLLASPEQQQLPGWGLLIFTARVPHLVPGAGRYFPEI